MALLSDVERLLLLPNSPAPLPAHARREGVLSRESSMIEGLQWLSGFPPSLSVEESQLLLLDELQQLTEGGLSLPSDVERLLLLLPNSPLPRLRMPGEKDC